MTDEEIQCVILKAGCTDLKGFVHLAKISTDHGIDTKRVLSNVRSLRHQCLVRTKHTPVGTKMTLGGDVVITEKGKRKYKTRCEQ